MASASVPVSCGAAWMLKGIFSRSAHSTSRSNTTGLTADPRASTGPPPSLCSPARFFSAPGQSVAWVTSTTSATLGSSPTALVRAPPPVQAISSRVVATPNTPACLGRSCASRRSASATTYAPMRLSMLRDTIRAFGNSKTLASSTPASPRRTRSSLARGPDIDPQVRDFRYFVHVLALHEVHRLFPDYAADRTLRAADHHALPHEDLGIPPADAGEIDVALVVHMRDLQSDLVDVAGEHEPGRALGIQRRHRVAVHVGCYLIGEGLHLVAPHAGRRRLEAGRPGRIEESFQEVEGVSSHGLRAVVGERRTRSRRRTLSAAPPAASVG